MATANLQLHANWDSWGNIELRGVHKAYSTKGKAPNPWSHCLPAEVGVDPLKLSHVSFGISELGGEKQEGQN